LAPPGGIRARCPARRWLAASLGLAAGLGGAEIALRAAGTVATYGEINFGSYRSPWGRSQPTWVLAWTPHANVEWVTPEFRYTVAANADGLRDRARTVEREEGRRRIVVLGDSFAEGAGAQPQDAWPALLERLLESAGHPTEVLNGGMSGSDPFFAYQLLRERLLRYRPDLVIVAVNQTDVNDVLWWGGLGRFRADGSAHGRPEPPGLFAFRHSHLARLFLYRFAGLDRGSMAFGPHARRLWEVHQELLEAFDAIGALRAVHDFELLVVVHPMPFHVALRHSSIFQAFHDGLAERGIDVVDLAEAMHAELDGLELPEFAWPIDGHFNARGYAALARCVARVLLEPGADGTSRLERLPVPPPPAPR
jgi:lysophospholipase L1-like esterase